MIPQFYFPKGRKDVNAKPDDVLDGNLKAAKLFFEKLATVAPAKGGAKEKGKLLARSHFGELSKALNLPLYWKGALWVACGGNNNNNDNNNDQNDKENNLAGSGISYESFEKVWTDLTRNFHDSASKFVRLLAKPETNYITQEDLHPLIQDVVDSHPGLQFLQVEE